MQNAIFVSKRLCALVVALISTLGFTSNAAALPELCDQVAGQVSKETGVPLSVLLTITRTETGRTKAGKTEPWPWTVNMEGKGVWFDTEDAARKYVFSHFKQGARSFDVGCFQINYKWHGHAFRSIDQMFDPLENARYAAKFLKKLHVEFGDWTDAAGAYHSRTPEYAERYKKRFTKIRNSVNALGNVAVAQATRPENTSKVRSNRFPLLRAGNQNSQLGSLFPSGAAHESEMFEDTAG